MTSPLSTLKKVPLGLRIIAMVKLVNALALMALGLGLFHLMGGDMGDASEHFVRKLHLDPENKYIVKILAEISGLSPRQLKAIDAGTFICAALYIIEGIGLLLAKHWAEYFTVIATASLVPVEIYELTKKISAVRVAILLINIAIVAYLFYRLRTDIRQES